MSKIPRASKQSPLKSPSKQRYSTADVDLATWLGLDLDLTTSVDLVYGTGPSCLEALKTIPEDEDLQQFSLGVITRYSQLVGLRLLSPDYLNQLLSALPISHSDMIQLKHVIVNNVDDFISTHGINIPSQTNAWKNKSLCLSDSVNIIQTGQHQGHLPGYLFHARHPFQLPSITTASQLIGLRLLGTQPFDLVLHKVHPGIIAPNRNRLKNAVEGWLREHGVFFDDDLPALPHTPQKSHSTPLRSALKQGFGTPVNARAKPGQELWSPMPSEALTPRRSARNTSSSRVQSRTESRASSALPDLTGLKLHDVEGLDLELHCMEALLQLYRKGAFIKIVEVTEFIQEIVKLEGGSLPTDWKQLVMGHLISLVQRGLVKHTSHPDMGDAFCISDKGRANLKQLLKKDNSKIWDQQVLQQLLGRRRSLSPMDIDDPMDMKVDGLQIVEPVREITTPVLQLPESPPSSTEEEPSEDSSVEVIQTVTLPLVPHEDLTPTQLAKQKMVEKEQEVVKVEKNGSKGWFKTFVFGLLGSLFAREHVFDQVGVDFNRDVIDHPNLHPSIATILSHAHKNLPSSKNVGSLVEKAAMLTEHPNVQIHVKKVGHGVEFVKQHAEKVKSHTENIKIQAWDKMNWQDVKTNVKARTNKVVQQVQNYFDYDE